MISVTVETEIGIGILYMISDQCDSWFRKENKSKFHDQCDSWFRNWTKSFVYDQ